MIFPYALVAIPGGRRYRPLRIVVLAPLAMQVNAFQPNAFE